MNKITLIMIVCLLGLTGCSTKIANAPFYAKGVSDAAIEKDGTVEYTRTIKVTPAKALIPVIVTNNGVASVQTIPPELIVAGGEAAAKIITPIIKSSQQNYVELRGSAQIEVQETYKRQAK